MRHQNNKPLRPVTFAGKVMHRKTLSVSMFADQHAAISRVAAARGITRSRFIIETIMREVYNDR